VWAAPPPGARGDAVSPGVQIVKGAAIAVLISVLWGANTVAIKFGLDQRGNLDAIDFEPPDVPIDVGIGQQYAVHVRAGEIDLSKDSSRHVDVQELRALKLIRGDISGHRWILCRRATAMAPTAGRRPVAGGDTDGVGVWRPSGT